MALLLVTVAYLNMTSADDTPTYLGLTIGLMEMYPLCRELKHLFCLNGDADGHRKRHGKIFWTYYVLKLLAKIFTTVVLILSKFDYHVTLFCSTVLTGYYFLNLSVALLASKWVDLAHPDPPRLPLHPSLQAIQVRYERAALHARLRAGFPAIVPPHAVYLHSNLLARRRGYHRPSRFALFQGQPVDLC